MDNSTTSSLEPRTAAAIRWVADYFDARKVGETGNQGFRRSTHLGAIVHALNAWLEQGLVVPGRSRFLDLGCGDGRVNLLFSYITRLSVGFEIDEWTLDEYRPLRDELERQLLAAGLPGLPNNLRLFNADTLVAEQRDHCLRQAEVSLADFDVFFTFLTLHDAFAELIAEGAKSGAVYIVYGVDSIVPRYAGLHRDVTASLLEHKLAVYRKPVAGSAPATGRIAG